MQSLPRQEFRRYFQPSRIVIGVVASPTHRVNLITLCFNMHCSYKPPMMAFAVWHGAHSYSLFEGATQCVLAVPGEKLAKAAMTCGVESGREMDKVAVCGLTLVESARIKTPGIRECIANMELGIFSKVRTGDHLLVTGEVLRFGVDTENHQRCLLSVGPDHDGYEVLERRGIHRIGVVADSRNATSR